MHHETFRHLDRDWEAAIPESDGDHLPVRYRTSADDQSKTYQWSVPREELEDGSDGSLALRRGLESALILDVLEGHEAGLTAEEISEMTGMPTEAAEDRLEILDDVQPILETGGPRRFRTVDVEGS